MARKRALGFGFIPEETNHHFLVLIPKDNSSVKVYERFEWDENFENESLEESQHKVSISKHKWIQIKEPLQKEFNKRLKKYNLNIGRWSNGRYR